MQSRNELSIKSIPFHYSVVIARLFSYVGPIAFRFWGKECRVTRQLKAIKVALPAGRKLIESETLHQMNLYLLSVVCENCQSINFFNHCHYFDG